MYTNKLLLEHVATIINKPRPFNLLKELLPDSRITLSMLQKSMRDLAKSGALTGVGLDDVSINLLEDLELIAENPNVQDRKVFFKQLCKKYKVEIL